MKINQKQKKSNKLNKRQKQLLELATERLAEIFIMMLLDSNKSKNENLYEKRK